MSTRTSQWPGEFEIPKFSVDVEYRLRQGNLLYLRDGANLKVTKELKHDILQKLAETMYTFQPYPDPGNFEEVAKALVQTHPCLKERGSSSGFAGWVNSLKFKMGNYRTKLRQMGRRDVTVNSRRRGGMSPDGEHPRKNIKKAKKGELNFLPDFPDGMDEDKLEELRQHLAHEMKKAHPSTAIVNRYMDLTFALRRKEAVHDKPPIAEILHRWPALFTESQICYEFNRIVGKNLSISFLQALDQIAPNMIEIFKKKTGTMGQKLNQIILEAKTTTPTDIRCLVLRGLPVILGDDPGVFFRTSSDATDELVGETAVGLLMSPADGAHQPPSCSHQPPSSGVAIILEGSILMADIETLPQAF
ncbi:uncharacterized protein LOC134451755 [Engraulis encrasicolus]|uniref:uncharacterized protein LOC134451755 n=1 Tax=Engraulis encrasicolus TaxID=184585 RepID=UPI002FCE8E95